MAQISFTTSEDEARDDENYIERREYSSSYEKGAAKSEDEEAMPLFPKIRQDQRKTVHCINVYRRDPPHDGFKGTVPATASMEYIASLYGNGLYDFEACLEDGKILRRSHGVKISYEPNGGKTKSSAPVMGGSMDLLAWQAAQAEKDSQRASEAAGRSMDMVRSHAETSVAALREHMSGMQERDRTFFQTILQQQADLHATQTATMQTFFAAMLSQTQADHRHFMERSREEHRQTMEVVYANNRQQEQSPTLFLDLIRQGMLLASGGQNQTEDEEDGDDENSPWAESIREGISAVKDITEVFKTKQASQSAASPTSGKAPSLPASGQQPSARISQQPPTRRKRAVIPGIEKEDIRELARLKILLDQRGIDFSAQLKQLTQMVAMGGLQPNVASESADPPEQVGEETGSAESDDSES